MPTFYFDLYDGDALIRDHFGISLETVEEAAEQAATLLPDIVRDVLPAKGSRDVATFVRDQDGAVVHRAALLYRVPTPSQGADLAPDRGDVRSLVMQSHQLQAKTRQLSASLDARVMELLAVLQTSTHTITETKALVSNRFEAHMK